MNKKGFTLIELLVVIAIIGILASVILASLNTARTKARDAERMQDMHQIQTALNLYYDDHGNYPASGGGTTPDSTWTNSGNASWDTLATALQPYIPSLAKDPIGYSADGWYGYSYYGCGGGKGYLLVYVLETASGPDKGSSCIGTFYQMGGTGTSTKVKTLGSQ